MLLKPHLSLSRTTSTFAVSLYVRESGKGEREEVGWKGCMELRQLTACSSFHTRSYAPYLVCRLACLPQARPLPLCARGGTRLGECTYLEGAKNTSRINLYPSVAREEEGHTFETYFYSIGHQDRLAPAMATDTVKKCLARSRGLLAGFLALLLHFGVHSSISGAPLVA